MYVLKTRSVLSTLVPLNGRHYEFGNLADAIMAAKVAADDRDGNVHVVDGFGDVAAVVS